MSGPELERFLRALGRPPESYDRFDFSPRFTWVEKIAISVFAAVGLLAAGAVVVLILGAFGVFPFL